MSELRVETMCLGMLETNCYLVYDDDSLEGVVVDPGDEAAYIQNRIQELGLKVQAVWNTHTHGDHIGANREIVETYKVPLYVHQAEAEWLEDPERNLSMRIGFPITSPSADCFFEPGAPLELLGHSWTILHTDGHSPGGVSLAADGIVLTGDALFAGSIGRTDLPGGDAELLMRNIREKLYSLPDETIVYPGHGPTTTIGQEKKNNPFVRAK